MSSASRERGLSLGTRLTLYYVAVYLGSTLLLVLAAGLSVRLSLRAHARATMGARLEEHRQIFLAEGVVGLQRLGSEGLYVRVLDEHATVLFEHRGSPDLELAPLMPHGVETRVAEAHLAGRPFTVGATTLPDGARLELASSDDQLEESFARLRDGLVIVWCGALVLGLVGGFHFTRRALRPLGRLAETARRVIESGDLALRVPVRGARDELDQLGALFNGVLARNEALVRTMREALDNVAHDLRTPLTRLRTGAEVALQAPADPTRLRDALADSIEESERVLGMLTTLMDISEAEAGVMKLSKAPVPLAELAREAIELYEPVAGERSVRVVTHLSDDVTVQGDRARLGRVVGNLLDNALKYTPAGGQVEVTVERRDAEACLVVRDTGRGVARADLPRIWERLYRADESRSERGLGLGLSFVKAIVEAHGGRVAVDSTPGRGATFTVSLPAR